MRSRRPETFTGINRCLARLLQLKFYSKGSQCTRLTKPEANNRSGEEFSVAIVPTAKQASQTRTNEENTHQEMLWKRTDSKCQIKESSLLETSEFAFLLPRLALLTHVAQVYTSASHLIMKAKFSKDEKQSDVEPEREQVGLRRRATQMWRRRRTVRALMNCTRGGVGTFVQKVNNTFRC